MLGLNDPANNSLPASTFPERADEYVCDKCGRDVTKYLHRRRAHVDAPLGPARYRCVCGAEYLSGAVEWAHLSRWERRRRLGIIELSCACLMLLLLMGGLLVFFTVQFRSCWLLLACAVILIPVVVLVRFSAIELFELIDIGASIWRTRVPAKLSSRNDFRNR